jgi:hypothetical protein
MNLGGIYSSILAFKVYILHEDGREGDRNMQWFSRNETKNNSHMMYLCTESYYLSTVCTSGCLSLLVTYSLILEVEKYFSHEALHALISNYVPQKRTNNSMKAKGNVIPGDEPTGEEPVCVHHVCW